MLQLISGEDGLKLSPVTDSWGLGCMMLEMLTGKQMWYNERHEHKTILTQKVCGLFLIRDIYIKTTEPL